MLDKSNAESIHALRVVFEVAGSCDRLKVMQGSGFGNFAALDDYPLSEESQGAAAILRAAAGMLEQDSVRGDVHSWPDYFWNHSLSLEPCTFDA